MFDDYVEGGELVDLGETLKPVILQSASIGIYQFNAQTLKSLVKREAV